MKKILLAAAALASVVSYGYSFDENEYEPVKKLSPEEIQKLTPEQLAEYKAGRHLYTIHRNGGIIWIDGKGKMLVSIVNDAAELAAIAGCVGQVKESLHIKTEVKPIVAKEVSVAMFAEEMKKTNAQLGVFVVDAPNLPQSLYAMEEGWAMVNVSHLKADNPSIDKLLLRERKAVARGFMMALGCASDQDNTSPMKPIRNLAEFDKIPVAHISFWNLGTVNDFMAGMGVVPDTLTTYKRAALAGIAPTPTNKWQQAIWDQVHAIPANPMKIEFDPKKGR